MKQTREAYYDVIVVGSGIAGIAAALEAAEAGCSVALLCKGALFSGSSFYPGTWGLGFIGPENAADEQDLEQTILKVGCGMALPEMVHAFVPSISDAIEHLRRMGVQLKQAVDKGQKEFIPCFDHKQRSWNGILFESARAVFGRRLEELGVRRIACGEVLRLVQKDARVCGVLTETDGKIIYLAAGAVVLASGGYGSLFRYHLCTEDVLGTGQALALEAGAELINMEFMQMMPGCIAPAYKTIFNEKTFRFASFYGSDGVPLFDANAQTRALMELRSTHGPFTARLSSRAVDERLFAAFLGAPQGVEVRYAAEMRQNPPEFIRTYFDWLRTEKGIGMDTPIHIGIFAHAANGGIKIDPDGATGVPGLYACGEVTGGMHGADRLGGLSTANGLTFGRKAGAAAAMAAREAPAAAQAAEYSLPGLCEERVTAGERRMQTLLFENAMTERSEAGLAAAQTALREMEAELTASGSGDSINALRFAHRLKTAQCIVLAARERRESRGSHFRRDYPETDAHFDRPALVWQAADGSVQLRPLEKGRDGGTVRR